MEKLSHLYTAKSIIEKNALLNRLSEAGLHVESPARDTSRKYTENTVDLSLGGYSVFFDGFKIFVAEVEHPKAKILLDQFLKEIQSHSQRLQGARPVNYNKFHFFGLATFFIPVLPHVFGFYYLYQALKNKEKTKLPFLIFSFGLYLLGPFVAAYFVLKYLRNLGVLGA